MKKFLLCLLMLAVLFCYAFAAIASDESDTSSGSGGSASSSGTGTGSGNSVVPNFVGMRADEAQTAASNAGSKISKWIYQKSIVESEKGWENTVSKIGSSSGNAPSDAKAWKVVDQISEGALNKITLTVVLNVINTANNDNFCEIMNEDTPIANNPKGESFAQNHIGDVIEFTGCLVTLSNISGTDYFNISIGGLNDQKEYACEAFYINRIPARVFTMTLDNADNIAFLSLWHIIAKIEGFSNDQGIQIQPLALDYLGKFDPNEQAKTQAIPIDPPEYAMRAAVTGMTNLCAYDGKTHTYSDTSGDRCLYYMFVVSEGDWTQSTDNTYHVTNMQLRSYGMEDGPTGEYDWHSDAYKFTFDLKYDTEKQIYTITNVYRSIKQVGDASYMDFPVIKSDPTLSVPFALIEQDRAT